MNRREGLQAIGTLAVSALAVDGVARQPDTANQISTAMDESSKKQSAVEKTGDQVRAGLVAAFNDAGAVACNDYPTDDAELVVAEGIRHITRLAASGAFIAMECDAAYPYLIKMLSLWRQYGLPGVDCVYHYATLHGDYRYALSGNRGSATVFEIEVWQGYVSDLRNWKFFSTGKRSLAPNEVIHVKFSREAQEGDWLQLPPGECCVLVRQYYGDWDNELPALLQIEREGAIYPPPQLTLAEAGRRAKQIESWLRSTTGGVRHAIGQHLDADPHSLPVTPIAFGFTKLRYLRGHYRCARDQAVILEVKPPVARYWNFQIGNLQWEALDYHMRQVSINQHQAVVDSDGIFRAVISHDDPGVANWLDAGGRTLGLISGRYYSPQTTPAPTLRTIPLTDLKQYLPADTRVVSAAQRQVALRGRMLSTIRRGCGD